MNEYENEFLDYLLQSYPNETDVFMTHGLAKSSFKYAELLAQYASLIISFNHMLSGQKYGGALKDIYVSMSYDEIISLCEAFFKAVKEYFGIEFYSQEFKRYAYLSAWCVTPISGVTELTISEAEKLIKEKLGMDVMIKNN
jgi:hypothetical protein